MSDIVERLRNHALPDPHDEREVIHAPLLKEAANEITALRAKVEELEARLAFKEVADHPNDLLDVGAICDERDSLQDQLAAEQFHSAQLRGAMLRTANYCRIWGGAERARKVLEHYLAIPHDTAALDSRLKEERVKCKDACENIAMQHRKMHNPQWENVADECAEAIGSLT